MTVALEILGFQHAVGDRSMTKLFEEIQRALSAILFLSGKFLQKVLERRELKRNATLLWRTLDAESSSPCSRSPRDARLYSNRAAALTKANESCGESTTWRVT